MLSLCVHVPPKACMHTCMNAQTYAHKYNWKRLRLKPERCGKEFLQFHHSCNQSYVQDVLGTVLSSFSSACTWHLLMSFLSKSEPVQLILFSSYGCVLFSELCVQEIYSIIASNNLNSYKNLHGFTLYWSLYTHDDTLFMHCYIPLWFDSQEGQLNG
jgi:hypothetical protein